jgi:tRNA pseudouridine55 synthase
MDGVINIYKNKGMTSFDVVRIVRKISKIKKVGHTGTLDPAATGVLPVCLGKATKIIDYIMDQEKSYFVEFKLGVITTTYDLEGEVTKEADISNLSENQVMSAIENFKGEYMQIPPMYSALKKDGVRLYDLARQGIEIEREGRKVNIIDIKDIKINMPYISMEVTCSKGTYIRSLCYDIGNVLGVGATVTELSRTKTASFSAKDSINIDELTEDNIIQNLISMEQALSRFPKMKVTETFSKLLINGVKVADKRLTEEDLVINQLYRVYDQNSNFIGLGKKDKQGFKIEKLLI